MPWRLLDVAARTTNVLRIMHGKLKGPKKEHLPFGDLGLRLRKNPCATAVWADRDDNRVISLLDICRSIPTDEEQIEARRAERVKKYR